MTRDLAKGHAIGSRLEMQFRGGEILDGLRGIPAHRLPGIQYSFRSDHQTPLYPCHALWPDGSGRKISATRRDSSFATSLRFIIFPEPVGHSTRNVSP